MLRLSRCLFENSHLSRDHAGMAVHELAAKAGLLHQDASGIYSLLALGHLAQAAMEQRLREGLCRQGLAEIRLALLQDKALWQATGREADYEGELLTVALRSGQAFALSATAEEHVTAVVKSVLQGRAVDQWVFQIGTKWRDELRCRGGLVRAREFTMMDAYRFAGTEEAVMQSHLEARDAFLAFFAGLGLQALVAEADCGAVGGLASEEFQVASSLGGSEGVLEVGHSFLLGQRYSQDLGLRDHTGQAVWMGCQGLGVSRTLMAWLEAHRDERGFYGDDNFSIVDTVVVVLNQHKTGVREAGEQLARRLGQDGVRVVLDDRDDRAGKKLADSELIGARQRVVVSDRTLRSGLVETTCRRTGESRQLEEAELLAHVRQGSENAVS